MGIRERKGREKENRRQMIIDCAERLFMTYGTEKVRMEEIADKCELSRATIYLYFKSREAILKELILKGMTIIYDLFKSTIDQRADAATQMEQIGQAYFKFYTDHRSYFMLIISHDHHDRIESEQDELFDRIIARTQEIFNIIIEVIQKGIDDGYFRENVNPYETAMLIWSASNGVIRQLDHFGSHGDKQKLAEYIESRGSDYFIQLSNIDLKRTLQNLWRLIIAGLRKKKY